MSDSGISLIIHKYKPSKQNSVAQVNNIHQTTSHNVGFFYVYRKPTRPLTGVFLWRKTMAVTKILSAGTVVEISTLPSTDLETDLSTATFDDISCALTGISTETTEREQIETTSLCETYSKTYVDGLKDQDTASSDAFFSPKSDEGKALQAAADSGLTHILRVTFKDGSKWSSLARVQPFGFNASVGDTVKTTINFKLVGEPKLTTV